MWYKVKKEFGSLKVGDTIQLKGSEHHKRAVTDGYLAETEAPKVEEKKPVDKAAYSTTGLAGTVVAGATVPNLEKEKEALASERAELESIKAEFAIRQDTFQIELANLEKEKTDFAKEKANYLASINKPAKPAAKKKEENK